MAVHSSRVNNPNAEGPMKYAGPGLRRLHGMLGPEVESPPMAYDEQHEEPQLLVDMKKLEEDTVKNRLKDLARDLKALNFDDMMAFASGVCHDTEKAHETAIKISGWAGEKLKEDTPLDEKSDTQQSPQDAGAGDLSKQEV